ARLLPRLADGGAADRHGRPQRRVDRPRPGGRRAGPARARDRGDPLRERAGGARASGVRRLRRSRVPAVRQDGGLVRLAAAGAADSPLAPVREPARPAGAHEPGAGHRHPAAAARPGAAAPVRRAVRYFYEHDGFFLAAGLSFYVVICIVPFVLLLVAGGAFLVSDDMVLREVLDRLAGLLPVYQSEMEAMLRGVIRARGVSSVVGTLILVVFASQLFAAT